MAVTHGKGWARFVATDDRYAPEGGLYVKNIVIANTSAGVVDVSLEDAGGTVFCVVVVPADDTVIVPVDTYLDGIDVGTIAATTEITAFIR